MEIDLMKSRRQMLKWNGMECRPRVETAFMEAGCEERRERCVLRRRTGWRGVCAPHHPWAGRVAQIPDQRILVQFQPLTDSPASSDGCSSQVGGLDWVPGFGPRPGAAEAIWEVNWWMGDLFFLSLSSVFPVFPLLCLPFKKMFLGGIQLRGSVDCTGKGVDSWTYNMEISSS